MGLKNLTIKEAKNKIKQLENELDVYLTKMNLNYLKTQPVAVKINEIVVDSSHMSFDNFLNCFMKNEKYDSKIYDNLVSIYTYKLFIVKELERMSKYDEIAYITYLRDEDGKSWKEIDNMLHRGAGYSKLKLIRYKNSNNI